MHNKSHLRSACLALILLRCCHDCLHDLQSELNVV
eukprot:COSAG04_NODE_16692_length_492_cov_0.501272_1_plen_34_part_10